MTTRTRAPAAPTSSDSVPTAPARPPCLFDGRESDPRVLDAASMTTRALGALGEQRVAEHLLAAGWRIVARNVRFRAGELDVIALENDTLVFGEVKTRRSLRAGVPQSAVTPQKLRRIRTLAGQYLLDAPPWHRDLRVDVFAVTVRSDRTWELEHLRGVF
jgi:putative endonuclease